MKFMVTWQIHQGKIEEAYALFSQMTPEQDAADRGQVKQIGRWHDVVRGRGVTICESDSTEAVANWCLNWSGLLNLDLAVVLDDNETRALGKARAQRS